MFGRLSNTLKISYTCYAVDDALRLLDSLLSEEHSFPAASGLCIYGSSGLTITIAPTIALQYLASIASFHSSVSLKDNQGMQTLEAKQSPASDKRSRHARNRSSGDFSIEEISADDMGYDADIEVIKPDKYEEVESESEDGAGTNNMWRSVDDELAARMRRLGRERTPSLKPSADRGRKRRSVEMDDSDMLFHVPLSPGLEVQEVLDETNLPSPAKRRRKRGRRPFAASQMVRNLDGTWTDSSDRADRNDKASQDVSTLSTPSEQTLTRRDDDDEMMDVT